MLRFQRVMMIRITGKKKLLLTSVLILAPVALVATIGLISSKTASTPTSIRYKPRQKIVVDPILWTKNGPSFATLCRAC